MLGERNDEDSGFYSDPVIGYRTWAMDPTQMTLAGVVYSQFEWPWQQDAVASCMRTKIITEKRTQLPHAPAVVPVKDCHCGFYAYQDYETLQAKGGCGPPLNKIRGVCIGWGKVWTAEFGWRAKYARPVAFLHWEQRRAMPTSKNWDEEKHREDCDRWNGIAYRIAEKYDARIVHSPEELTAAVQAYLQ